MELRITNQRNIYKGTYYGKQENDPINELEREYTNIRAQINMLKLKGELILT